MCIVSVRWCLPKGNGHWMTDPVFSLKMFPFVKLPGVLQNETVETWGLGYVYLSYRQWTVNINTLRNGSSSTSTSDANGRKICMEKNHFIWIQILLAGQEIAPVFPLLLSLCLLLCPGYPETSIWQIPALFFCLSFSLSSCFFLPYCWRYTTYACQIHSLHAFKIWFINIYTRTTVQKFEVSTIM